MADTMLAPTSYKQPSRKGKKAWRKNVDLNDLTANLEDVRTQIIQHGGVVSEKPAADLFALDTTGDSTISLQQSKSKLLKADEILAQRSAVPGLEQRKRKAPDLAAPDPSAKRSKNGKYISHKQLQHLRTVANRPTGEGGFALAIPEATHDPWAPAGPAKHAELDFLEPVRPIREPSTLRHAPVSLVASGKVVPAVPRPAAGKSYNPLVQDWSALLEREGAAAVEAEKARVAAELAEEEQVARAEAEAAKVEAAEKEEWATDYESAWESEWDGIQSGAEGEANGVFTAKMKRRKTPAERNKILARKQREAAETHERRRKERLARKAGGVKPKLAGKSARGQGSEVSDSSDDGFEPALRRNRFGKRDVPAAPLEVVLPEDLQDSLRRLKPEGNLLTDRYRNLLVNGKVEVRKRLGQRKLRKVDKTEKWSYKDWKLK
ncbi:hypothetical protein B0A48_04792 [Cryoendolithus antarcticus]|uniref:Ribosome biogenesis protein NOP53 n=1 Tax=Cryoendolithus antarcticus TaxID=1507870 RepID=A0A1V8TDP7_9PEZI|nr:hypothetical protein B0A48_04792 [Cryoendolithus antarcticus]